MKKRHRREFLPTVQSLEDRCLLDAAIHAIGSDGHFNQASNITDGNYSSATFRIASEGDVTLNGQFPDRLATPTTVDNRTLNVAVGSKVNIFDSVLARDPSPGIHYNEMNIAYYGPNPNGVGPKFLGQQFIPCPDWANPYDYEIHSLTSPPGLESHASLEYGNPGRGLPTTTFSDVVFSIEGESIVSADPLLTSYSFADGNAFAAPTLIQTEFTSGSGQDATYAAKIGTDLGYPSTNSDRYDVGFYSFYVGATPGIKHLDIDAHYANGTTDHIVFTLNVLSPQATLNSVLATDTFRFGPFLESTSLEDGSNFSTEWTAVDWNDFDYNNLDPHPEVGVWRNYQFGGAAPGLYPNRFDGTGTNVTATPGKFYVVQFAKVTGTSTSIYDSTTHDTIYLTVDSPKDSNGNALYGLDAFDKSIDAPWAMLGLTDQPVADGGSGQVNVPSANSQPGWDGATVSYYWDSPKATIPQNANARTGWLQGVQYHLALRTFLVYQATDSTNAFSGIPVGLLSKDWSIDVSMTNTNPEKSWANSYTVEANWEGTAIETSGQSSNTPQLLNWSYNVPSLVANPQEQRFPDPLAQGDPDVRQMGFAPGNAWTFTGQSGVDPFGPQNNQYAAYLYGGSWSSSISQSFTLLTTATYHVSFDAAQYYGYQSGSPPVMSVDVLVDGNLLETFTPTVAADGGNSSHSNTQSISLDAGTHTVTFRNHADPNWPYGWYDGRRPYFYNYVLNVEVLKDSQPSQIPPNSIHPFVSSQSVVDAAIESLSLENPDHVQKVQSHVEGNVHVQHHRQVQFHAIALENFDRPRQRLPFDRRPTVSLYEG